MIQIRVTESHDQLLSWANLTLLREAHLSLSLKWFALAGLKDWGNELSSLSMEFGTLIRFGVKGTKCKSQECLAVNYHIDWEKTLLISDN